MWKILIIASTRPNHASFPHTYKIFNQQTMSHYISVVNTHQYTGAYHATFTLAAHCFSLVPIFFTTIFEKYSQKQNNVYCWISHDIGIHTVVLLGGKKWKINAPVHMLKLIICKEAKIYLKKKKKLIFFFENVITLKEYEKTL